MKPLDVRRLLRLTRARRGTLSCGISLACAASVLGGLACEPGPTQAEQARCRALGRVSSTRVVLHTDSVLTGEGSLVAGPVAGCSRSAPVVRALLRAHSVLATVPPRLRPERLVVHWLPSAEQGSAASTPLETHAATGDILVASPSATELDGTVWLHEIAHVRMRGARPAGRQARRLLRALEEGAADYFAATLSGSSFN